MAITALTRASVGVWVLFVLGLPCAARGQNRLVSNHEKSTAGEQGPSSQESNQPATARSGSSRQNSKAARLEQRADQIDQDVALLKQKRETLSPRLSSDALAAFDQEIQSAQKRALALRKASQLEKDIAELQAIADAMQDRASADFLASLQREIEGKKQAETLLLDAAGVTDSTSDQRNQNPSSGDKSEQQASSDLKTVEGCILSTLDTLNSTLDSLDQPHIVLGPHCRPELVQKARKGDTADTSHGSRTQGSDAQPALLVQSLGTAEDRQKKAQQVFEHYKREFKARARSASHLDSCSGYDFFRDCTVTLTRPDESVVSATQTDDYGYFRLTFSNSQQKPIKGSDSTAGGVAASGQDSTNDPNGRDPRSGNQASNRQDGLATAHGAPSNVPDGGGSNKTQPTSSGNSQSNAQSGDQAASSATDSSNGAGKDTNVYFVSTEADNSQLKRQVSFSKGQDDYKVDLPLENRPVSLLTRAIVGYDQSGATSVKSAQKFFFDLFVTAPFPRQRPSKGPCQPKTGYGCIDPDFGPRVRVWGDAQVSSVPQQGTTPLGSFVSAGGLAGQVATLQVGQIAQSIQFLVGGEVRLSDGLTFRTLLPSFDHNTKQKFALSFIGAFGGTTPANPQESVQLFKYQAGVGLPPVPSGTEYVAYVPPTRDRLFRQYYGGFRIQSFFFNRFDRPFQRFPAVLDLMYGQNEFVTRGHFRGGLFRFDGYYPLPYESLKSVNLFGTFFLRPTREHDTSPIILQPAPAGTPFPASNVAQLPAPQLNRDYYRIGVGIDFVSFTQQFLGYLANSKQKKTAAANEKKNQAQQ